MGEPWEEFGFLVGTWRGRGSGGYATIEDFTYEEEISFSPVPGKAFLVYTQRTWHPDKGFPMHGECGYFRPAGAGRIEAVIALPTGQVEIQEGTVKAGLLDMTSTLVGNTSTAKTVTHLTRRIEVDGDLLRYEVGMAAVGRPLGPHLRAELRRT